MRTSMSCAGRPAYYSVQQVACILGVEQASISRAIRVGTLASVYRHGRRVVPASVLVRLLGRPVESGGAP